MVLLTECFEMMSNELRELQLRVERETVDVANNLIEDFFLDIRKKYMGEHYKLAKVNYDRENPVEFIKKIDPEFSAVFGYLEIICSKEEKIELAGKNVCLDILISDNDRDVANAARKMDYFAGQGLEFTESYLSTYLGLFDVVGFEGRKEVDSESLDLLLDESNIILALIDHFELGSEMKRKYEELKEKIKG